MYCLKEFSGLYADRESGSERLVKALPHRLLRALTPVPYPTAL